MGRPRTNVFIRKPDRIAAADLRRWMAANDISINKLALALSSMPGFGSVKYRTVEGWLLEYRHCPAWLEHRINFMADHGGKLPRYGQRWPEEAAAPEALFKAAPEAQATCECGAPLKPDGQCSWLGCPFDDDNADANED